jgi:hypothetical protein
MIVSMPRSEPANFRMSSRNSIRLTVKSSKSIRMINITLLQGLVTE